MGRFTERDSISAEDLASKANSIEQVSDNDITPLPLETIQGSEFEEMILEKHGAPTEQTENQMPCMQEVENSHPGIARLLLEIPYEPYASPKL